MHLRVTTSDGNSYDVKEEYEQFSNVMSYANPGQLLEFTLTDNRKVAIAAVHIVSVEVKDGPTEGK